MFSFGLSGDVMDVAYFVAELQFLKQLLSYLPRSTACSVEGKLANTEDMHV